MGYIYLRTNLINGKKYVGQVITKRFKTRQSVWNNLNHPYAGKAINAARAKYGIDAFDFEIIKECEDEELNQWEMYYIKELNTKTPYGYNMTDGGDSGCERTEETRKKIGAAHRGRKLSPEHKAKLADALKDRKQSPEHIAKKAAAQRGKKRPAEVGAKISAALRGRKRPDIAAAKNKAVQALNPITMEVVMEFASTKEAGRQGFNQSAVSACCRGERKSHGGFIWRFAV